MTSFFQMAGEEMWNSYTFWILLGCLEGVQQTATVSVAMEQARGRPRRKMKGTEHKGNFCQGHQSPWNTVENTVPVLSRWPSVN